MNEFTFSSDFESLEPPERYGIKVDPPTPRDFGLDDYSVKIFETKKGLFKFFDPEFKAVKHLFPKFKEYKESVSDYREGCYRLRAEYWLSLSAKDFETAVARVFKVLGWETQISGGADDKGVDIWIRRNQKLAVVQCKAWNRVVGPSPVREFHSSIITANADFGFLVTSKGFSQKAFEARGSKPIVLCHAGDLVNAELATLKSYRNLSGRYNSRLISHGYNHNVN